MRSQPAQLLQEPAEPPRARSEQLALNRHAVGFAHDASIYGAMNAAVWERRGLLQRLRRRPPLREAP